MMDGNLWPAYILHSRPYQEDKLLLQLLLPEQGRLSAVIRRRSGKQHRALQPFQLFAVTLTGRSNLKTVRQLEEQRAAYQFTGKVLFSGLYINELICRLWPTDSATELLFEYYQAVLAELTQVQQQPERLEPCLRQFEFSLLAELGVLPDWGYDGLQQALQPEQYYSYVPEQGFMPVLPGGIPLVQRWRGAQLMAVAAGDWQHSNTLVTAKQLSRQLLTPLLGDKPLASRALFSQPEKINLPPAWPQ